MKKLGQGLGGARVVVHGARAGSVVVEYHIIPPPTVAVARCVAVANDALSGDALGRFAAAAGAAERSRAKLLTQLIQGYPCVL